MMFLSALAARRRRPLALHHRRGLRRVLRRRPPLRPRPREVPHSDLE